MGLQGKECRAPVLQKDFVPMVWRVVGGQMWGLTGDDYLEKRCRTPNVRSYTRECQEILQKYKYIILLSH